MGTGAHINIHTFSLHFSPPTLSIFILLSLSFSYLTFQRTDPKTFSCSDQSFKVQNTHTHTHTLHILFYVHLHTLLPAHLRTSKHKYKHIYMHSRPRVLTHTHITIPYRVTLRHSKVLDRVFFIFSWGGLRFLLDCKKSVKEKREARCCTCLTCT